jgi:hypothetical protein
MSTKEQRDRIELLPGTLDLLILLLPVMQIASIVTEAELLHVSTIKGERYTINDPLKDLEACREPHHFIRLSRGTLVNIDLITKVSIMPGRMRSSISSCRWSAWSYTARGGCYRSRPTSASGALKQVARVFSWRTVFGLGEQK